MANLTPNDIVILVTVLCLRHSNGTILTMLPLLSNERDSYANCSRNIIKSLAVKDVTLVNIKDNNFLEDLHSLNIKTLSRTFLATKLDQPNEAYIVQCDDLGKCENGLNDLVKDRYWNPNAIFVFIVRNFNRSQELFLQKLHRMYIFRTVLVLHDRVYFYDFKIGDHCFFTTNAVKNYECERLSSDHELFLWTYIKSSLEEKPKTPYSECNISVLVSILEPFVFPPLDENNEPKGFEEEFIKILKNMNFSRIKFHYNLNMTGTGTIAEDFTVSGVLSAVESGVVDYVLGGTLLSHYRLSFFDFTYPHLTDDFVLIVPKARQIDKWEVMYTVFEPLVWGLILVAFVFVALVAFVLKFDGKRDMHVLVLTMLDMYGYLTNNASKKSASFFMLSWALFAWLITCFYQCDLSSVFTKPTYYKEVDSLSEILNRNYKFYLSEAKYNYMKGSEELDMDGLVKNSTICETDYECLVAVAYQRRKYTLASRLGYEYFEAEFHTDDGEPMLHRIVQPHTYIFRTGYLRKGNPNIKRIRFLERQVIAFGFHRRSLLAYIHINKVKYHKSKKKYSKPLSCTDIAGLYYIFMCGCGMSLVTFFIEIALNK